MNRKMRRDANKMRRRQKPAQAPADQAIPVLPTACKVVAMNASDGPRIGLVLSTVLHGGTFLFDLEQTAALIAQLGIFLEAAQEEEHPETAHPSGLYVPEHAKSDLVVPS